MKKGIRDKILELKNENMNPTDIAKALGCNRNTVNYHLSDTCKKSMLESLKKYRATNKGIQTKKERGKYESFLQRSGKKVSDGNVITYTEFTELIKEDTCYLSGRKVEGKMNIDHKIPVSKGGTWKLDNLGVTTREANMSKSDMTLEEYIELCKDVLTHNGYTITKT